MLSEDLKVAALLKVIMPLHDLLNGYVYASYSNKVKIHPKGMATFKNLILDLIYIPCLKQQMRRLNHYTIKIVKALCLVPEQRRLSVPFLPSNIPLRTPRRSSLSKIIFLF